MEVRLTFSYKVFFDFFKSQIVFTESYQIIRNTFQGIFSISDIIIVDSNHSALLSIEQHVKLYQIIYTESITSEKIRWNIFYFFLSFAQQTGGSQTGGDLQSSDDAEVLVKGSLLKFEQDPLIFVRKITI